MEKKMVAFLSAAQDKAVLAELLDEAFRLSMANYPQASVLWMEGQRIKMESFEKTEDALDEFSRHTVAFFVPASWHEKREYVWIEEAEGVIKYVAKLFPNHNYAWTCEL